MPRYLIKTRFGIHSVGSSGDGYSIKLKWYTAFPTSKTNSIAYNIYWDTDQDYVLTSNPKYVSIDSKTEYTFTDFEPGQLYFFNIRPVEYNPLISDLNLLINVDNGIKTYPTSYLREDISESDLIIPLEDSSNFPSSGYVKIGYELIEYDSIVGNNLNAILRGANGTTPTEHLLDGYDGYNYLNNEVIYWIDREYNDFDKVVMCQSRFEYPNYPYRDGYGYKQVEKDLLNSDLSESDKQNEGFPYYSYVGWRRRDPSKMLAGDCVGSYIGGYQFCADGYNGVGMQLRPLSFQDANNQRQEVLLEQTGEPFVLLKRMYTGVRCACYQPSSEYPDDRCPKCFVKGTLVRTESGFKPIEEIVIGEKVLSSDGNFYSVTKTISSNYDGYLSKITTSSSVNPILCTPEHPILTLRGWHSEGISRNCGPKCNNFIKNGDGHSGTFEVKQIKSGNWHARAKVPNHDRKVVGTFSTKEIAIEKIKEYKSLHFHAGHELKWDFANNIKENDWLVSKWSKKIEDIDEINIPQKFLKNTRLGNQRNGFTKFKVDEEFMWICGLYIAEGSGSKRTLNFALHKDEVDFQKRIMNFFEKYGYSSKVRKTSNNGVVVNVNGSNLPFWFKEMFGTKCYNKKIPEQFMNLPNKKIEALIDGIYCGDGCKDDHEIAQTSEILALQIVELLHKLNKKPLARKKQNNTLTPKGNKRKMCYYVNWETDNSPKFNRNGRWKFNEQLMTKVRNVDKEYYNGIVYNLEVEGDHTYVVQDILVHNCYGVGITNGYYQYFNDRRSDGRILVRFSPADEDVKVYDAGWESELITEAWTLVIPTINDRDILVRYDVADNEEYRYEVLTVNRQKTVLGQSGGQKMRVQRIRKTDIAYQIPVFKNTQNLPSNLETSLTVSPGLLPHKHTIRVNETNISNFNQMTSVEQGHTHQVKYNPSNGQLEVLPSLNHTHMIII